MSSVKQKILETARQQSVFRAGDIDGAVDPRSTLRRMVQQGELMQAGRGLYAWPDSAIGPHHGLVLASARYPGGVICLISALVFHGIGTQMPYEAWMMRQDRRTSPPSHLPIRFVYCTGPSFTHGIEMHALEGTTIRVYSPAKTVADCFKYRNKIGLDVAIEALREGWRDRRFSMDTLWAAAKACRVQGVIQPYMEMLVQ